MREILFKGKRIDNDKWVIGSYVKICVDVGSYDGRFLEEALITELGFSSYEIEPETLCQSVKNDVYVGDIVYEEDDNTELYVVSYDEEECGYYLKGYESNTTNIYRYEYWETLIVIGNIHDKEVG